MHTKVLYGLMMILAVVLAVSPDPVVAQGACLAAFEEEAIVEAIELSPAIAAHPRDGNAILHTRQAKIVLEPGLAVRLAADARGRSNLVTDDWAAVGVGDNPTAWVHDFRVGGIIAPIAPQDLTSAFEGVTGPVVVTFESRNVLAPEARSSAYWLIIWRRCEEPTATPTATLTATPIPPTSTFTPTVTPTPTATGTPTPTSTMVPTSTSTPSPTATEEALVALLPPEPPEPWPWRSIATFGLAAVVLFGLGGWVMMVRSQRLHGTIRIYDREDGAFVEEIVLSWLGKARVAIGKYCDVALPGMAQETPAAFLYMQRHGDERVLMMDVVAANNSAEVVETIELADGQRMNFDPYVLVFHQQQPNPLNIELQEEGDYV